METEQALTLTAWLGWQLLRRGADAPREGGEKAAEAAAERRD